MAQELEKATLRQMIKTLAHLCILSKDLQKTHDFYCGVLGLQKKFDFLKDGQHYGFYLQIDPLHFIEFFKTNEEPAAGKKSITHICFEVGDIEALRELLVTKGIAVTDKKLGVDHSWQVWCKDPDGVDVEFHQYTPESSQFTGANCVVNW